MGSCRCCDASLRLLPSDAGFADGRFYFAHATAEAGNELWTSDGTPEGTALVADLNAGPLSSNAHQFVRAGTTLFFTASSTSFGEEVWAIPLRARRRVAK